MKESRVGLLCIQLDFTNFSEAKILVFDSFRYGTKNSATSFAFLVGKSGIPIGLVFFFVSTINIPAFFQETSAGRTAFLEEIAAVKINSQQKFYDNGASAVLSRLVAVSPELTAILEK